MRIRPAVITGAGSLVALAAVTTIVLATTPDQAGAALIGLLWAAVFIALWGILTTVFLLVRWSVSQAVWASLFPAIALLGLLKTVQQGTMTRRLLGGVILATLVVATFIWWRLRSSHTHD